MLAEQARRAHGAGAVYEPLAVEALVRRRPKTAAVSDADPADGLHRRVGDDPGSAYDARRLGGYRQRRGQARLQGTHLTQSDRTAQVHHVRGVPLTANKLL